MALYRDVGKTATMGRVLYLSTYNNTTNVIKDEKKENNNYYSPGACARARVREEADAVQEIYAYYCDTFARPRVAPAVRKDIHDALEAGADSSLILYAIDTASMAPSPAWAYARAVIRKCMADGCRTSADCEARAERHAQNKRQKSADIKAANDKAPNFMQRQLTDTDFENGFYRDPFAGDKGAREKT